MIENSINIFKQNFFFYRKWPNVYSANPINFLSYSNQIRIIYSHIVFQKLYLQLTSSYNIDTFSTHSTACFSEEFVRFPQKIALILQITIPSSLILLPCIIRILNNYYKCSMKHCTFNFFWVTIRSQMEWKSNLMNSTFRWLVLLQQWSMY